jgi:hypothetical protein
MFENPLFVETITLNKNPPIKPVVLEDLKSPVFGQ